MKRLSAIIGILLAGLLIGCGGGGNGGGLNPSDTDSPPANAIPVAEAGANQYANIGANLSFDGSASTDDDNDDLTYQWSFAAIPAGSQAQLTDEQTPSPSLTVDLEGIYSLQLIVNDGKADSEPDVVMVATPGMLLNHSPDKIVIDKDGVVYLASATDQRIYRWSMAMTFPLEPIPMDNDFRLMAYSPGDHRLYLGYEDGTVNMIDLTAGVDQASFAATPLAPHGLAIVGNFVLAADASGGWDTHYIYAADSRFVTSVDMNQRSSEYAWNAALNRVYFFRDGTSPNDLHYEEIDQTTGLITGDGESPYHGDYKISPPIRVSSKGDKVLLGSGDIYDADTLKRMDSLYIEPLDAIWMDAGLLTLRSSPDGRTLLEQWGEDLQLLGFVYFDGEPLRIFRYQDSYAVMTLVDGKPAFHTYTPTDDVDGDSVSNWIDAFPLDPAASVDSDGDGYPDAWNQGQNQADSTTDLVLDAFPEDSACQLPSHGLPSDLAVCDIANGIPDYTPDQILVDSDNVVYLLSAENHKVFRWSLIEDYHMNPIHLDDAPQLMAYSPADQRLYLSYDNGAITFIDLSAGVSQAPFATTPRPPHGLTSVGNFVLAADASGAWNTHYIFDANGALVASEDWNYRSQEYAWNSTHNRVYFFRDGTSPNDLHYEEIDQTSGLITDDGETPDHSSAGIQPPIRISKNGSRVLLGSGYMYDAISMEHVGTLSVSPVDALWTETGLLTLRESTDGRTLLERWNAGFDLEHSQHFDGLPLRLIEGQGGYCVITMIDNKPMFDKYQVN